VYLMFLLEAIDEALDNTAYRRKLIIRAIEDAIIILRLCITIAAVCSAPILFFRLIGLE